MRIPWVFRGWNQDRTGMMVFLSFLKQINMDMAIWFRKWDMEPQNKTRKAIVRPMIVEGPIKNSSTTASLLASIVGKKKMERPEEKNSLRSKDEI